MKKIIALLTATMLLLLLGVVDVFAYDEEITFQNISWGSSLEEVKEAAQKIYGNEKPLLTRFSWGFSFVDCIQGDGSIVSEELLRLEYSLYADSDQRVNIAGYEAKVKFTFLNKGSSDYDFDNIDKNTLTGFDKELIQVQFSIKPENEEEAKNDLIKKLSDIYGGNKVDKSGHGRIWQGKNNTEIWLTPGYFGGDTLCVSYRIIPSFEPDFVMATPVPKDTPVPTNNVDPNNKNGL